MLEMHIAGWTNKETAEYLDCSPQTVSNVICSDKGQEFVKARMGALDQQFLGLFSKVIDTVSDGLDHEDMALRLTAADKWLKAHGRYAPKSDHSDKVTAEDIVARLLDKGGGKVEIHDSNVVINPKE
jgi:hypothetical protein